VKTPEVPGDKEGAQGMEIRNPEYMDFVEGLF
jgi:hypothetical protein